jgi:AcrR family transcriptional regulator
MAHKRFFSRDPRIVTERILDAAEAEFETQGFTGASTNRIAETFGGSKTTLFRYYPTKAELFVAVMSRISERLLARLNWNTVDHADPIAWLTVFARLSLQASLSSDALFVGRMVIAHGHEFPVIRETFASVALNPVLNGLAEFLRESTERGLLNCADCERDAVRFFDLVVAGWTTRALFGIGQKPSEAFLELEAAKVATLFVHGRDRPETA